MQSVPKMRLAMLPLLFTISFLLIVPAIYCQCITNDGPPSKNARTNLYLGEQTFTLSMLKAINKTAPDENIFFSPYSTFQALLLAYFGANGNTETELKNALNLGWTKSKYEVLQAYKWEKSNQAKQAKTASVIFRSADKIFVSKETELRQCIKDVLDEEFETLDFARDPDAARQHINAFVEEVTDGNIKDILIEGSLTEATKIVLANAAYFKGQWASKFNVDDTKQEVFYSTPEKHSFVDMMYKKSVYNHAVNEALECHTLEIPYLGENSGKSMMIFLPPFTPNGLENVLSRLTPKTLDDALEDGISREVELKLPTFSFEKTYQMLSILGDMGINDLFNPSANLTGFSDQVQLNLDDAIHKAKIEVNEEGSTAAAATVLFSFRSSRPTDPAQFFCDHPFLFLIFDHKSKAILFTGIYRGPE